MPNPLVDIGSPPQSVLAWLESFADDNDYAASKSWLPWARSKYRGQAWAFRTAAELVRKAIDRTNAAPHKEI